jgi:hypothetical protein
MEKIYPGRNPPRPLTPGLSISTVSPERRTAVSVDYTVYVGPWFLCRCERVRMPGSLRWCCANPDCPAVRLTADRGAGACSLCGKTLQEWRWPDEERDAVDPGELQDRFDDTLLLVCNGGQPDSPALRLGTHAWLPNVLRIGDERTGRFAHLDPRRYSVEHDLRGAHVSEQDWLQTRYAAQLEVLHAAYGEANVEVGWGVLTYVS